MGKRWKQEISVIREMLQNHDHWYDDIEDIGSEPEDH